MGINFPQNMASVMSQHQRVHFTPIFILIFTVSFSDAKRFEKFDFIQSNSCSFLGIQALNELSGFEYARLHMNQMLWELSFNKQALKGHQVLIVNFTTFIFKTGRLELATVLGVKNTSLFI